MFTFLKSNIRLPSGLINEIEEILASSGKKSINKK
jgi:hypothetical protein